jgi:hypothetical protein
MIVNLQSLSEHLDSALDRGDFPILYPEFLVRSQIAVAERLEAILDSLEIQRLGKLPTSREKASESKPRVTRRYSKAKDVYHRTVKE